MTDAEAKDFIHRLVIAFPAIDETARFNSPDLAATHRVWATTLLPCTLAECDAVLSSWLDGSLAPPGKEDRNVIALAIRQTVFGRRGPTRYIDLAAKQAAEDRAKHGSGLSPMAPIVVKAMKMNAAGASQAEIAAYVERECPPAAPHDQPRYNCGICLDRGTVEVWRFSVAKKLADQTIREDEARGTNMVACTCDAGTHHATANKNWRPMPRYSPSEHCRWRDRPLRLEQASLAKWLADRWENKKLPEFNAWAG